MSGLFFLALAFIWLIVVVLLTRWLMKRIGVKSELIRMALAPTVFVVLLALPVTDEIVGGWQFNKLCETDALLRIDAGRIKGRTVRIVYEALNAEVGGVALTILHSHISFRETTTGNELGNYDEYAVKGGWFIRTLGVFNSDVPLLVLKPWCGPALGAHGMAKAYQFTLID